MPYSRVSRFGFVNTYLVEEEDGLTVIDTMIAGLGERIVAAAEAPASRSPASCSPTRTRTTSARSTPFTPRSPTPR